MVKTSWVVSLREMEHTGLKQLQSKLVGVKNHKCHGPYLCLLHASFFIFHYKKIPQMFNANPELSLARYKNIWHQEQNCFLCKTGRGSKASSISSWK